MHLKVFQIDTDEIELNLLLQIDQINSLMNNLNKFSVTFRCEHMVKLTFNF